APGGRLCAVKDRGNLRYASARHDTGGADGVVDDSVVSDEAVRRAIHLDVVDRDRGSKSTLPLRLHDLEVLKVPLLVADVQAGLVAFAAVLNARVPQSAARRQLDVAVREAPVHEEAEDVEEFDEHCRGVVEAQPIIAGQTAVTVEQAVEQTLQVPWITAQI